MLQQKKSAVGKKAWKPRGSWKMRSEINNWKQVVQEAEGDTGDLKWDFQLAHLLHGQIKDMDMIPEVPDKVSAPPQ